jgi:hypothetical protein
LVFFLGFFIYVVFFDSVHFQSCIIIFLQNHHALQCTSANAAPVFETRPYKKLVFCFWNRFLTAYFTLPIENIFIYLLF